MGATSHRFIQDAGDWMRDVERRVMHEERRPSIQRASDIMGPGLGPYAVLINDWSGEEVAFNGYFYSQPGALHSPDVDLWWMGQSIAQVEGFGIQTVWDYRGTTVPIPTFSRRFSTVAGARVFTAWA